MSKFEDGSYGSLTGVALIAKVLAGRCSMKYTRAAVGEGKIPDEMTPKTMSGAAGYVMDAKIAAVTNPVDGECQVTVQIKSDNVERGFYATNIVLFAEDPDEGEVPYTYLLLENEPEWIRPASSIVGKLATFDIIAAVGDVDAVTAIIDPEAIATVGQVEQMLEDHNTDPDAHGGATASEEAMREMLSEHNADPNAHGGIGSAKLTTITIPESAWVQNGENYTAEVAVEDSQEGLYPSVTLYGDALAIAYAAGMSQAAQALDGKLRFWSAVKPTADMTAAVALFFHSGGSFTPTSMPIATGDTVGGVKVKSGSGLNIDESGNLSLDNASTEEVEKLLDDE